MAESPLSPYDVMRQYIEPPSQLINERVRRINQQLLEEFSRPGTECCSVMLPFDGRESFVIDRFKTTDWVIESVGLGYDMAGKPGWLYRFKLPGKILTDRGPSVDPAV